MSGNRQRQITPFRALRDFFDYVYGDREGYSYCPTKNPSTGEWSQNFFQWPQQTREIVEHFLAPSSLELYYSPALYRTNRVTKEAWLGTQVLWTEMDFGVPTAAQLTEKNVPPPTLRVRSSTEDRQHWYWKLAYFENDPDKVEKLTRRITYSVDGDMSAWDYQQVLRPPGTVNHKRQGAPVGLLVQSSVLHGVEDFVGLPEPPQRFEVSSEEIGDIPEALSLIAKYKWNERAFDLFKLPTVDKDRSSKLCALAYECAEMGMADKEILSILINADDRWGKFKQRNDRVRRLQGIIARARFKYPVISPENLEDDFPVFGFESFLATEVQLDWVMEGLLTSQGMGVCAGPPDVGKTQLALQLAIHIALGKEFLIWPSTGPRKNAFISMEMGHDELKYFLDIMAQGLTREEKKLLQKNLIILPLGEPIAITRQAELTKVCRLVEKYQLQGIFIDSLGVATGEGIDKDDVILPLMSNLKTQIIKPYNAFVWFVHHTRKAQVGNKKPNQLADLHGSQYIGSSMTTAIGLWKDKPDDESIEVNRLKGRLAKPWTQFEIARTDTLGFVETSGPEIIVGGSNGGRSNSRTQPNQTRPGLSF